MENPGGGSGPGRGPAGRGGDCGCGTEMTCAATKLRSADSQLVRCSTGSHVSPDASLPTQRTRHCWRPRHYLKRRISCTSCSGGLSAETTMGSGTTASLPIQSGRR